MPRNHIDAVSGAASTKSEHQQNEADVCKTSQTVSEAALWLAANPDQVQGPIIPFMRSRFSLSAIEAIAVCKTAHALRYAPPSGEASA